MKKAFSAIFGTGLNVLIYAVAIFILFRAGAFAYDFAYEIFGEPVVSEYADEEVRIEIKNGEGGREVAAKLKDKDLINNELAFAIKTRLTSATLKPGIYVVKASMSGDEMIQIMSDDTNSLVKQKTADELQLEAEAMKESVSNKVETESESHESEMETDTDEYTDEDIDEDILKDIEEDVEEGEGEEWS